MRPVNVLAALALVAIGAVAGRYLLPPESPMREGLFADRDLARAVIEAGAVELAASDCALSIESGRTPTVADFLLDYSSAAALPPRKARLHSECGGRGVDKCSVSYSVMLGEKADTNILLFSRDGRGRLVAESVTCIAQ